MKLNAIKTALATFLCVSAVQAQTQNRPESQVSQYQTLLTQKNKSQHLPSFTNEGKAPGQETQKRKSVSEQHFKLKRSGGMDGGGGDIKPSEILTKEDIVSIVNSNITKIALKMMFNDAANFKNKSLFKLDPEEYFCNPRPQCMDDYISKAKLFANLNNKLFYSETRYTIYDAINSAQIIVQDKSCLDSSTGKETDASAFIKQNTICISYERLISKVSKTDLPDRLLVLLAHEYTHLLGATEAEALALEVELREWSEFYKFSLSINTFRDRYATAFSSLWDFLNDIQQNLNKISKEEVCTKLIRIHSKYNDLTDLSDTLLESFSMTPYQIQDLNYEVNLTVKVTNSIFFCKDTGLNKTFEDIRKDFADEETFESYSRLFNHQESSLPLSVAVERVQDGGTSSDLSQILKGEVRNLKGANLWLLQKEIMDVQLSLQQLRVRFYELFKVDPITTYQ